MIIAMMFIIGVGVFYHACLYPDHGRMFGPAIIWYNWHIWKIVKYPYWQLYGETFLDYLDSKYFTGFDEFGAAIGKICLSIPVVHTVGLQSLCNKTFLLRCLSCNFAV